MVNDIEPPRIPQRRPRLAGLSARMATGIAVIGLLGGGLAGGFTIANAASSPSPAPSSSSSPGSTPTSPGTFRSNENPTHEAGESAAREAAENNGTAMFGPPPGGAGPAPAN